MRLFYDLHLHSCLSPCGDGEMTPRNLANMAALCGLEVVALTDHNTVKNCPAFLRAAEEAGLVALPGMELTCAEEAHILCLFPGLPEAEAFGDHVYSRLPDIPNRPDIFGPQVIVDENDRVLAEEPRLLLSAADIGIYDVAALVQSYGGVAIPAHIDRDSFSLLANLGFWDPAMGFARAELSYDADEETFRGVHPELDNIPFLRSSDAHRLESMRDAAFCMTAEERSAAAVLRGLRL